MPSEHSRSLKSRKDSNLFIVFKVSMLVKKTVDVYPVINIIHDHHTRNRNNLELANNRDKRV